MNSKKKPRVSLLFRISVFFILALIITAVIGLINSRKLFQAAAIEESRGYFMVASAAALELIDADSLEEKLVSDEKYRQDLHRNYRNLCMKSGLDYIYIYTIDADEHIHYLLSAGNTKEQDDYINSKKGFLSVDTTPLTDSQRDCLSGGLDADYDFIRDDYGMDCVWTTPVYDSAGNVFGLLSAHYSIDFIDSLIDYYGLFIAMTLVVFLLVSMFIAFILLRAFVSKPIGKLAKDMKLFAEEKQVDIKTRKTFYSDEVTDIEESFEKMVKDISGYVEDIKLLTAKNVQNKTQLDIARKIQEGTVPEEKELSDSRADVYGMALPATEVGGDFYDIFYVNEDELCILNGDVSGKGISAALFMMVVVYALKEKIKAGISLEDAINQTNQDACRSNPECMFATVFVGIINLKTGVFTYANAGHNAPCIISEQKSFLNMDPGIAIGVFEDYEVHQDSISLKRGDGVLIYTDGITEAWNKEKEQFGMERLLETVTKTKTTQHENNARTYCRSLVDEVFSFARGQEQFDDITCVALIYKG